MKRVKVKQGTLDWEKLREHRIGGSEVFDIVRYYAADEELQNCGINAEDFKAEQPYTTAWLLYHKMLGDGIYRKEAPPPELAEYGHAAEPYGVRYLSRGRKKRLKPGEVYISDRLIASLDVSGIAEETDCVPFCYGHGKPKAGQKFVCEQKTMLPQKLGKGMPFKYIVQAQYQILQTKADFFILQVMVLKEDTPFIRGKICQMSSAKRYAYLDENMTVGLYYFQNNEHLARLIEVCIERFFDAVDNLREPTPYIRYDSQSNIIESIRLNSAYNDKFVAEYDLQPFAKAKAAKENAAEEHSAELQRIVEFAKEHNACRFRSEGYTAAFSKNGRFLLKAEVVK